MQKRNLNVSIKNQFDTPFLTQSEFKVFSEFIFAECGINLPLAKKTMLSARLNKRLHALEIATFSKYYDFISSPAGRIEELHHMIDVVTTNKTEFFREATHFDFLINKALPEITKNKKFNGHNPLYVWSAGCSTGEEPYTLGIVLSEFFSQGYRSPFSIIATDISTRVLQLAAQATYSEEIIQPVPPDLRQKYLLRGKGSRVGSYRVVPELRKKINFRHLNFMEGAFAISEPVYVIFCRNVIIYFNQQTQIELFKKFFTLLKSGGYLFIGSSETLHGINDKFQRVAPSIYKKDM